MGYSRSQHRFRPQEFEKEPGECLPKASTSNSPSILFSCISFSLSKDLYSSDSHFVLELVQNADDNVYGSDVTPSLQMTLDLDSNTLVVACNESGFEESQVKAICKIGASTKKFQEGYIGKGDTSGNGS